MERIELHRDVTVLPSRAEVGGWSIGSAFAKSELIEATRHDRYNQLLSHRSIGGVEPSGEELDSAIWGGPLFAPHFGHFLMESTSRLWASEYLARPEIPVVFVAGGGKSQFSPFVKAFLELVGVTRSLRLVESVSKVGLLYVPAQVFGLGPLVDCSVIFKEWVRNRVPTVPSHGENKLFVSRSRFSGQGKIANEMELEERLSARGFEVFHPEQFSLAEQLATYQRARTIVFSEGSSMHFPAFFLNQEHRVACIQRRPQVIPVFRRQFRFFSDVKLQYVNAIREVFAKPPADPATFDCVVDIDEVENQLAAAGFG